MSCSAQVRTLSFHRDTLLRTAPYRRRHLPTNLPVAPRLLIPVLAANTLNRNHNPKPRRLDQGTTLAVSFVVLASSLLLEETNNSDPRPIFSGLVHTKWTLLLASLRGVLQRVHFQLSLSLLPILTFPVCYFFPAHLLSSLSLVPKKICVLLASIPRKLTFNLIKGTSDGLSPSLSSVHTGSSQASHHQPNMQQYTYGGQVQGGWASGGGSSYHTQGQPPMPQSPYGRQSIYGQGNMGFANPRSSQSPATGAEGLPAPPFDQVHQSYHTGAGHDGHTMTTGAPAHAGILTTQNSTQPPTPSSATAHVDPYAQTRPPSNPSYYTSSGPSQHQSFSSYPPPQHSPTQSSPTTAGPGSRGLGSVSGQHGYRSYGSYQQLPTMGGPVMSNMHQPGGQMSMIPGMGVGQGYGGHAMVYGHNPPQPQSERPFKCDQCIQSFSRNHDLKRHKRIHLAVKPFPCSFCSKSFSRKDALKVSTIKV